MHGICQQIRAVFTNLPLPPGGHMTSWGSSCILQINVFCVSKLSRAKLPNSRTIQIAMSMSLARDFQQYTLLIPTSTHYLPMSTHYIQLLHSTD
jgi:hypothetical protein